jgi:hypothetical protein
VSPGKLSLASGIIAYVHYYSDKNSSTFKI